ncbi:hypothetical protein B296_00018931 [Ensete ventricosum]|uniref:Uncharacterized protein n=1 Tax=Ensete ventricosum TaxID=4639 RepID=A0A427AU65_ENSVE|nr:hypothetical protein B296_00018931 [Ensete ventricosum]
MLNEFNTNRRAHLVLTRAVYTTCILFFPSLETFRTDLWFFLNNVESMVILPAFGVQLEIHYWSDKALDRVVHTGPPADRYADRPLPGDIAEIDR